MSTGSYDPSKRRGRLDGYPGLWWDRKADGSYRYELKLKQNGVDVSGQVKDASGRPVTTEKAAILAWKKATAARDEGGTPLGKGGVTLRVLAQAALADLALKVEAGTRSERTHRLYADRYRLHIDPVLGTKRLNQLDKQAILSLYTALRKKKLAEWTMHGVTTALQSFLTYGEQNGYLAHDPFVGIDKDSRPKQRNAKTHENRRLRPDELRAMIEQATGRYKRPLTVLAYSGLRISELCGLTWDDIDKETIAVSGQLALVTADGDDRRVEPKWGRTRTVERKVPLTPEARKALQAEREEQWTEGRGRAHDFCFTTETGRALRQDNLRKRGVYAAAKAASLGHVKPHDLRHTYASTLVEANVPIPVVAAILGDSAEMVWDVYGKPFQDAQEHKLVTGALANVGFGG